MGSVSWYWWLPWWWWVRRSGSVAWSRIPSQGKSHAWIAEGRWVYGLSVGGGRAALSGASGKPATSQDAQTLWILILNQTTQIGNGPNTVSGSTVAQTTMNSVSLLWWFTEFRAELDSQFAPKTQWGLVRRLRVLRNSYLFETVFRPFPRGPKLAESNGLIAIRRKLQLSSRQWKLLVSLPGLGRAGSRISRIASVLAQDSQRFAIRTDLEWVCAGILDSATDEWLRDILKKKKGAAKCANPP